MLADREDRKYGFTIQIHYQRNICDILGIYCSVAAVIPSITDNIFFTAFG